VEVVERNLERVRREAGERGWARVLFRCAAWGARWVGGRVGLTGRGRFRLDGREHELFRHPYHYTWQNERAVEIPVFRRLVAGYEPPDVLEVGNVLAHYGPVSHRVVDRYERAPHVENVDVVELTAAHPYALIVAISTLEHVGLDEEQRDPGKAAAAIARLRGLLGPGGRLVFSVPVGYNEALDRQLLDGEIDVEACFALARRGGRWEEAEPAAVRGSSYDRLLYEAEAVLIVTVAP
jgi:hypothetical protein